LVIAFSSLLTLLLCDLVAPVRFASLVGRDLDDPESIARPAAAAAVLVMTLVGLAVLVRFLA
jgi:hypothetical protein